MGEHYASQQHRRYANAEYVRNPAGLHGVNVNREYAEVFQAYRVVASLPTAYPER